MALNITYERSALATFLEDLPKMMLEYQMSMTEMKHGAREAAKDRAWQESQTYITANLNELTRVRTEEDNLRKEARDLGVLDIALRDISEKDVTDASAEITRAERDRIRPAIEATERMSSAYEQNIDAFNRGDSMAAHLDTTGDGRVDLEELAVWIKTEEETKGVGWQPKDAFMMGVTGYTFDPDRRMALKLASVDIATKEMILKYIEPKELKEFERIDASIAEMLARVSTLKLQEQVTELQIENQEIVNKYLPRDIALKFEEKELTIEQMGLVIQEAKLKNEVLPNVLRDEEKLRGISIETGNKTLESMTVDIRNKKIQGELARVSIEATKASIKQVELAMKTDQFELDDKVRDNVMEEIERVIVDNTVQEAHIGAAIFTSISFDDGDKVTNLSLVFDIMATDPAAGLAMLEADNFDEDKFGLIIGDIQRLISSVKIGKTEDLIPDYSMFLKEVGKIKGLDSEYKRFINQYEGNIKNYLSHKNVSRAEAEIAVAELHPDDVNSMNIELAIQWNNTGIYDDMDQLESAIDVIKQRDLLIGTKDTIRNLDIGYTMKKAVSLYGPIRGTDDTTGVPTDTTDINQIFYNILSPSP